MKKLLSVVVVVVMLAAMSVSAFADAPTTIQNQDGSWTTSGSDAAYANSMMTVVAVTNKPISIDSIQYIDQTVANENGDYAFENYLPKVDPTGSVEYFVLVGGEKLANPIDAGKIVATQQGGNEKPKYTISGTVDFAGIATGATIRLYNAEEQDVLEEDGVPYTTALDGSFSFEVEEGTYTIEVSKTGHTKYTYEGLVVSEDAVLTYTIYGGEITNDNEVATPDLSLVIKYLTEKITDDTIEEIRLCDITEDGEVATPDLSTVIANLTKKSVTEAAPAAQ